MKRKVAILMLFVFFSLRAILGEGVCFLEDHTHYDEYKKSAGLSSGISVSTSSDYIFIQFGKPVGDVSLYIMSDKGEIVCNEDLSVSSPVNISIPYVQEGEYILLIIECKENGTTLQIPIFSETLN